mmetsp:Transcript_26691/g.39732  ORF Transcript_26691/g.39732 Transcript_26691/m.39732 type:complete len:103 (+) Transcript_26691:68-376(+)
MSGRKVRPWNGGKSESTQRSISGKITAFDHQSILITSVWMAGKTQCCPAEVKGICYYSLQDVSLGQFLRDSCFNLSLKCQVRALDLPIARLMITVLSSFVLF